MDDAAFSSANDDILAVISKFCSTLSFIGSSFIIASYLKFPALRKFSFELVMWLSVADIIFCMAAFLGDQHDGSLGCYIQALCAQFGSTSSVLWCVS
jgi:hypothetical protein